MVWIDLETTGLSSSSPILEVGIVVTNRDGDEHARFHRLVGYSQPGLLHPQRMEAFDMHSKNGLIGDALTVFAHVEQHSGHSSHTRVNVEAEALAFLNDIFGTEADRGGHKLHMCGASVQFDRAALKAQMPRLEAWFHYRQYDVSTLLHLAEIKGVQPDISPRREHRSIPDVLDEIEVHRWVMGAFEVNDGETLPF